MSVDSDIPQKLNQGPSDHGKSLASKPEKPDHGESLAGKLEKPDHGESLAGKPEKPDCVFLILGAGASKDSGLQTYRGKGGYYEGKEYNVETILSTSNPLENIWTFLKPLYEEISKHSPGKTYDLIKKLGKVYPKSFILTQNIDGYALSTGLPVVELHGTAKTMTCFGCNKSKPSNPDDYLCECGKGYRPDVVLFGEKLSQPKVQEIYSLIKRRPNYVLIIGTSLQFAYLRTFVTKAKQRGAIIIHINPDESYTDNVRKREMWYDVPASEGLEKFLTE